MMPSANLRKSAERNAREMAAAGRSEMARYITGIVGGVFIALVAFLLMGLVLGRMFEGQGTLDRLVGTGIPALGAILAGFHTFHRSVWPKPKATPATERPKKDPA